MGVKRIRLGLGLKAEGLGCKVQGSFVIEMCA